MPNRLISESSPYLIQHAKNPVDWYPWSEEAIARARNEKKPIFLSIGYSACHWCHVMERESFEDPAIAQILNRDFISIKVDREEQPELDQIYMSAVVAMTGQGGWPLTIFLTPDLQPFFGGTYFPPVPRYRMPSFSEVINQISQLWKHEPSEILNSAIKITAHLKNQNRISHNKPSELDEVDFHDILMEIERTYDWKNGGWGAAPKFPQPMSIEFLLMLSEKGETNALEIATHALGKMQQGGLFDLVGGGFHRYATDPFWLVPHFEKMLYDNSQLALVYLHAYLRTSHQSFRKTCETTLNFILRDMTGEHGGFYSSIDADSEGQEGKYYLWAYSELEELLGSHPHKPSFFRRHGISPDGNYDGVMILKKLEEDPAEDEYDDAIKLILRQYRQKRPRPTIDDKVILSWNALTIQALAEAGRYLNNPGYLKTAQICANFILERLCANNQMFRTWRDGNSRHPAVLDDYASLVIALVSLYQADFDSAWLVKANEIVSAMVALFTDSDGYFYDTQASQSNLLFRPSEIQDNAIPSGTSLAVRALLAFSAMANNQDLTKIAHKNLSRIVQVATRYPLGYAYGLQNILLHHNPFQQIGLLYHPGATDYPEFIQVVNRHYTALRVFACSSFPPIASHPEFIQGHRLDQSQTTLFICKDFTCLSPIHNLAQADFALSD